MKKQKLIFRADGDSQNGLGHMFRLFAMVEMLRQDFNCTFVTRADSTLNAIPTSFTYTCIPAEFNNDNELNWLSENFPSSENILVLDGYKFNLQYQRAVKHLGYSLVYIDDLCAWHMLADLVINHAPSASSANYSKENYTRLALGTQYALLRPTFLKMAKQALPAPANGNIFVAFGGADPLQLSKKILKFIYQMPEVSTVHLVQGAAAKLEYEFGTYNDKLMLHSALSESQLAELMKICDIGILPTSTVLFEWCCIKRAVITGYYANKQEMAYYTFVEKKAVIGIGDFRELKEDYLQKTIRDCLRSNVAEMMAQQSKLFDGNQRERIIDLLKQL